MAAFSHQHSSFLLDSIFLPSFPIKMSGLLEEGFINNSSSSSSSTSSCFPCSFPSEPFQETPFPIDVKVLQCSDNGNSITEKQKTDSSSMVLDLEVSDQIIQSEATPLLKKRRNRDGSCLISSQSKDTKKAKPKRQKKCNGALKETEEKKSKADKKNQKKVPEFPITGYVHVRARRGEATDSHSLAERVRRERISERLKMLQGLVPGCDKVTSKALMLDEIINYVQSLQHQVEFLSMKLSSVSPIFYEFGADFDAFMPKSEKQSNLVSPLPSLQQSIPTPSTAFADTTTTFTTTNNYSLLDNSVALLLQQGQRPNSFSQDNGNLLWDVDDQRQRLINQSGFTDLCSFQESNIKPAPTSICNNNRENNPRNPEEIKATFLSTSIPMEWASSTLHSDPIQVELKGVFGFEYGRNTMKAEEDEEEQLQSN